MYTKGLIIYIYIERERERERHDIGVGIDNNGKASMELKEERSSGYLVGKRRYFVLRLTRTTEEKENKYIEEKVCLLYPSSFFGLVTS